MTETQAFGSFWTVQKLDAVERYLAFYTTALKNQPFKLCYIDAFSGSGNVLLKDKQVIDGSALRALKYPFDSYFFFEKNRSHYSALCEKVTADYPGKLASIRTVNGDCNEILESIDQGRWTSSGWRGVIFIDPYAMDLTWSSLEKISKTRVFDVWYLFPLSAVTRNLPNNGRIPQAWEDNLTKVFGSPDWKQHIYQESSQMTLFAESEIEKIPNGLIDYIQHRLQDTFPTVSSHPFVLRNTTNAPMFLLCFAGSNPSEKAKKLSLNAANQILKSMGGENK